MQKKLLLCFTLFVFSNGFAQKTELKVAINSGLFSFAGPSASKMSWINYNDISNAGYTNNPYGSKNGLSFGLSGMLQRVSKKHFITGIELGYEQLASKIAITGISGFTGIGTYQNMASGSTSLKYNFVNLHPYVGYRFDLKQISLDLTGGFDVAYCLSTNEDGSAKDVNGKSYTTSLDRKTIRTDVRPRIQLAANFRRTGIYAGYSYGFRNYKNGYVGGVNECRARLVRFGITYQIH